MTHFRSNPWLHVGICGAALLLVVALVPAYQAKEPAEDLIRQQEIQKQVQADTDRMVRQMETMIRVLQFYKADNGDQKKMLDEAVFTLSQLSANQMNEVIARLDAAAKAPDDKSIDAEVQQAYTHHREIVTQIKNMLAMRDAISSLEQAAERLDKASKIELDMHLSVSQVVREMLDPSQPPPIEPRGFEPRRGGFGGPGGMRGSRGALSLTQVLLQHGDKQQDLRVDVDRLFVQMHSLSPDLPTDQKERLKKVEKLAADIHVLDHMTVASNNLKAIGYVDRRNQSYKEAVKLQWDLAGDLAHLARELRSPKDKLAALKEAKERLDRTIESQKALTEKTESPKEEAAKKVELPTEQGRLQHETREVGNMLKEQAADLTDRLQPAQNAMDAAKNDLQTAKFDKAAEAQKAAKETLEKVRDDLDKAIAAAEKEKNDPIAALKDLAEKVDKIIVDQKDLKKQATTAQADSKPEQLPQQAPMQKDLAKETAALKNEPQPNNPQVDKSLDDANKSMKKAAESLKDQKGNEAVAKQEDAIKQLEEAKKALEEKIAEIETRRDDLAKLEEAAKKLEELAKQEKEVGDKANELNNKNDDKATNDLAKKQDELTPQAREIDKDIAPLAPDAAKKVDEAAKKMDKAKENLDEKKPMPAAKDADQAAKKLDEASKDLAQKIDELKAEEIKDQAAMNQDQNPANAAQQVAKALEELQKAQEEAKKAAEFQQNQEKELAELQKEIANKADKMDLPEAKGAADDAAELLKKGDLPNAMELQKEALKQLQEAAKGQPMKGEKQQLAESQKALNEATKAAQQSQQRTQAAQAAIQQAQAQAPQAVQPQLQQAQQKAQQAGQQLAQGKPAQAGQAQAQAEMQLNQALKQLNQAAEAMGQQPAQPGQKPTAVASGKPPGMGEGQGQQPGMGEGQGQEPGKGQGQQPGKGQGQQPGKAQERNDAQGIGDRVPDGQLKDAPSQLANVKGEGAFLALPPRQRELIRQALSEGMPAEYAAMIQQYYLNLAKNKAPMPAPAPK